MSTIDVMFTKEMFNLQKKEEIDREPQKGRYDKPKDMEGQNERLILQARMLTYS